MAGIKPRGRNVREIATTASQTTISIIDQGGKRLAPAWRMRASLAPSVISLRALRDENRDERAAPSGFGAGFPTYDALVEPLPDFATLSNAALRRLIRDLQAQEHAVSYDRKMLQGRIDILKAQLAVRDDAAEQDDRDG